MNVEHFINAIRIVCGEGPPLLINEATAFLQNASQQKESWAIVIPIIGQSHYSDSARYFAANLLHSKVKRDIQQLSESELFDCYVSVSSILESWSVGAQEAPGAIVVERLCMTTACLASLTASDPKSVFKHYMELRGESLDGVPLNHLALEALFGELLEDSFGHKQRRVYMDVLSSNQQNILDLFDSNLHIGRKSTSTKLRCLRDYVELVDLNFDTIYKWKPSILYNIFQSLVVPSTAVDACTVCLSLCDADTGIEGAANPVQALLWDLVLQTRSGFVNAVEKGEEEVLNALCQVLGLMMERQITWISHGSDLALVIVAYALQCTEAPRRAIATHMMDAWATLQDIPVEERHPSLRADLYGRLLKSLISQSKYSAGLSPEEIEDEDVGEMKEFRNAEADIMSGIYYLLRDRYVDLVVECLRDGAAADWRAIEASLFALAVAAQEELQQEKEKETIRGVICQIANVQNPIPHMIASTAVLISRCCTWLCEGQGQEVLVSALKILVNGLRSRFSCAKCSVAIRGLVLQQHPNEQGVNFWLAVCESVEGSMDDTVEPDDRNRVIEGLVRLSSKLPKSDKAKLLEAMTTSVIHKIQRSIQSREEHILIKELSALATIVRFVDQGETHSSTSSVGPALLDQLEEPLDSILSIFVLNIPVVNAVYAVYANAILNLRSNFKSLPKVLSQVGTTYVQCPSEGILSCVGCALEIFGEDESLRHGWTALVSCLIQATETHLDTAGYARLPELIQNLFEMLSRCRIFCTSVLESFQILDRVVMLGMRVMTMKQREVRAALTFMNQLFGRRANGQDLRAVHSVLSERLGALLKITFQSLLVDDCPTYILPAFTDLAYSLFNCPGGKEVLHAQLQDMVVPHLDEMSRQRLVTLAARLISEKARFRAMLQDAVKIARGEMTVDVLLAYEM